MRPHSVMLAQHRQRHDHHPHSPIARLGTGCKVINSVLMDGVALGDGVHVQSSVLCGGAVVGDGAALKDCMVGPGYAVAPQADHCGETLAKA